MDTEHATVHQAIIPHTYHVTNLTTKQKVNQQKESKASLDEGRARFGYMFQREGRSRLPNASLSHVPLLILVV